MQSTKRKVNARDLRDEIDALQRASLAHVVEVMSEARGRGRGAWMLLAISVGRLQRDATPGDQILERLAAEFGLHRSRIARLGRIYRDVLEDRLAAGKPSLREQAWYEIACEASPALGKTALQLVADAETRKAKDPRYTTRQWKRDLGILRSKGPNPLQELLSKLAGIEDDVVEEFASERRADRDALVLAATAVVERASAPAAPPVPGLAFRAEWSEEAQDCFVAEVDSDFVESVGYRAQDVIGRPVSEFAFDLESYHSLLEGFRAHDTSGGGQAIEGAHVRSAEGERVIFPWEYKPRYRSDGRFLGFDFVRVEDTDAPRRPGSADEATGLAESDQWLLDVEGRTVSVSLRIALALGESPESMQNASILEFVADPVAAAATLRDIVRAPLGSPLGAQPLRAFQRRDGRSTGLELEDYVLLQPDGSVRGVMLSAPLGLREGPDGPQAKFTPGSYGTWVIDGYGRTVSISRGVAEQLGSTPEEMTDVSAFPYSTQPDRAATNFRLMRLGVEPDLPPDASSGLMTLARKDGTAIEIPLIMTRHHSPDGRFLGVSLAEAALTEGSDGEAEPSHLERDCIWICRTPDMVTDFVSPELAILLGSDPSEMIGQPIWAYLQSGDQIRSELERQGEKFSPGTGPLTRRMRRTDGSFIELTSRVEAHYDADGHVSHWIGYYSASRGDSPA